MSLPGRVPALRLGTAADGAPPGWGAEFGFAVVPKGLEGPGVGRDMLAFLTCSGWESFIVGYTLYRACGYGYSLRNPNLGRVNVALLARTSLVWC